MATRGCGLVGLVVRVLIVAITIGLAATAGAADIRQVSLQTNDIVYDPVSQRIYASVPSSAGPPLANSVVAIDPGTGSVGAPLFVGSEPGKLAVSSDGQSLYVALDGSAQIVRVRIGSWTADPPFALGSDSFFGPFYAEDIEVQPGNPDVIAVSLKNLGISPRHAGVAIYENGVQRPHVTQRHTGSNAIVFSADPTRLYGYNNETTEFGFRRLNVDADGVSEQDVTPNLIQGFSSDIEFDDGRVYATTGQAIDPELLQPVGTYALPFLGNQLVEPNSAAGEVYFLSGNAILTFDLATFTPKGGPFPIPGVFGNTGSLIRWGADGLAFRTDQGQVFLVEPPFVDETHNDFANARVIAGVPYQDHADTSAAGPAPDDPYCNGQGATVWYAFTPSQDMLLEANTFGSNYPTNLSVWVGARGALGFVACGADRVTFNASAGQTYYFMVGSYGPGGDLSFQLQQPADTDADGIPDTTDNCPVTPNPDQFDFDFDGRGNACDNCPNSYNPGQEDSDGDGTGDACEDQDGDGVADGFDNCRAVPNPDQRDSDFDGVGDLCDATPVHDLAVGILNSPKVVVRAGEAPLALEVKLKVFNLVKYRETVIASVFVTGYPPGCTLVFPAPITTEIAKLGDKKLHFDFQVSCGAGVVPGFYALTINAFVAHSGPGGDRDPVNNFASTTGLLRVR
jgi:DNA-binding beta-propeller fold protein YncE